MLRPHLSWLNLDGSESVLAYTADGSGEVGETVGQKGNERENALCAGDVVGKEVNSDVKVLETTLILRCLEARLMGLIVARRPERAAWDEDSLKRLEGHMNALGVLGERAGRKRPETDVSNDNNEVFESPIIPRIVHVYVLREEKRNELTYVVARKSTGRELEFRTPSACAPRWNERRVDEKEKEMQSQRVQYEYEQAIMMIDTMNRRRREKSDIENLHQSQSNTEQSRGDTRLYSYPNPNLNFNFDFDTPRKGLTIARGGSATSDDIVEQLYMWVSGLGVIGREIEEMGIFPSELELKEWGWLLENNREMTGGVKVSACAEDFSGTIGEMGWISQANARKGRE
ncbi:uncharacterized protein EDB93DRAFT_1336531 [Suillus bovinus]|uniref:uncharacterized protein n=1 Tax=Suillus bovinus TaxID=48563 RepID=UPI001B870105|nr:uncharacterized protein EDB93DRAFT_1336531 [Suillus bovinus]KAG2152603.1 hypothetical protein EDB93DRAFT_1336531 [Suillus bovinus]